MFAQIPLAHPTRTDACVSDRHVTSVHARPLANAMFAGWGPRLVGTLLAVGIATAATSTAASALPTIESQQVCTDVTFADAVVTELPSAERPSLAVDSGAIGDVSVEVDVAANGTLERAAVHETSGIAKFRPALDHCRPVPSRAALAVSFAR